MSYLLTIGKKVQHALAPRPQQPPPPQKVSIPIYVEPIPEPVAESYDDYGASPLTDEELTQESSEEQYASPPVPASTTSSHTEESSE
jgi:hypothetical protein